MESSLFKHVRTAAGLSVLLAVAWTGWAGLDRSLWLDEAWVANSVRAATWSEMWWGGEWLQTSPPLFVAVARAWVSLVGLSTESLRFISLFFALMAALGVQKAAIAAGAGRFSALAAAGMALTSLAVEYFTSFKQYGAEAAAAALLLWAVAAGSYTLLAIGTVALLPLAYPVAFLVPGILILVWQKRGVRSATVLGTACAAMLGGLYFAFIRPNTDPSLWAYWAGSFRDAYSPGVVAWVAASVGLVVYAIRKRDFVMLAAALPCVLLVIAELSGWYPASPRMRLFARPCFAVAAAVFLHREVRWTWLEWAAPVAAIGIAVTAGVTRRVEPFEDYAWNLEYLRQQVQPADLVLVHADARQGFELYRAMRPWDHPIQYGDTGWPCCARVGARANGAEDAVRKDLDRLIPSGFQGRIWLVYANRPLHWKYLGLDEGDLWRRAVWDRGCPPAGYQDVRGIVIAPMDCKSR